MTTPHDAERIREVRRVSGKLVTIGACATAGGIQALRNFASVEDFLSVVYASPEYVSTLEASTPISAHVNGGLRAARLPDRQAPAAGGHQRISRGPAPADLVRERVHRMQAPRDRLRNGRPRNAVPRSRYACRLRRHLSFVQPWVLRLLRSDGDAEHRFTHAPAASPRHERPRQWIASFGHSTSRPSSVFATGCLNAARGRSRPTSLLASRARGRCS